MGHGLNRGMETRHPMVTEDMWVLLPGGEGIDGMLGRVREDLKSAGTCTFLLETGELWQV